MSNGNIPILGGQPRRLTKSQILERNLSAVIDFCLAMAAMCIERGVFTQEHLFKMEDILRDARKSLGHSFTMDEGLKAVRAAFRIDLGER